MRDSFRVSWLSVECLSVVRGKLMAASVGLMPKRVHRRPFHNALVTSNQYSECCADSSSDCVCVCVSCGGFLLLICHGKTATAGRAKEVRALGSW